MSDLFSPIQNNLSAKERRIGVDIEFTGVDPDTVLVVIVELYGDNSQETHLFDRKIKSRQNIVIKITTNSLC